MKRTEIGWVHVSGKPENRDYSDWYPNEPDGGSTENCVEMSLGGNHLWNDIPCSTELNYTICEYRSLSPTAAPTFSSTGAPTAPFVAPTRFPTKIDQYDCFINWKRLYWSLLSIEILWFLCEYIKY